MFVLRTLGRSRIEKWAKEWSGLSAGTNGERTHLARAGRLFGCWYRAVLLDRLQTFALALPHVTVVAQWGGLVYKVAGKVFLVLGLDGQTLEGICFKCRPDEFDELTDIDGIAQAPYFAKRHWVKLSDPGALSEAQLKERLRHSHALVAAGLPKKTRIALGLEPEGR